MPPVVRVLSLLTVCALVTAACSRSESPSVRVESEPAGKAPAPAKPSEVSAEPSAAPARTQVALLAGGCFWGMEELMRQQPGVIDTTVGYTGGSVEDPGYGNVKTGTTGHAESVRVEFDPAVISYEDILLYFFKIHDPTTKNRQGNDVGSQYRSAIFVQNAEQRRVAERVKRRVAASGEWHRPIMTEIVDAGPFYPAEEFHQDYLQRNPGGYTCHYERDVTF